MTFLHKIRTRLRTRLPILTLLDPHETMPAFAVAGALGIGAGWLATQYAGLPIWSIWSITMAVVAVPLTFKWRADLRHFGLTGLVMSVLLVTQSVHMLEHIIQWIQFHAFHIPAWEAHGLVPPADSEWVHLAWNIFVLAAIVYLMRAGMRGRWAWILLAVALGHTIEHVYIFTRFVQVKYALAGFDVTTVSAQGLPGLVGRDGLLAQVAVRSDLWFGRLPGLTTAPRIDVHFWYNVGETTALFAAAHIYLKRTPTVDDVSH